MKGCVILLLFGVAAQLNASVIQPANVSEVDGDSIRVSRSAEDGAENEGSVDGKRDTVESEIDSAKSLRRSDDGSVDSRRDTEESEIDSTKSLRRSDDGAFDNKVLAFGLDTGVVDTKNSFVESLSNAFSGLVQPQHVRSNTGDKKTKPLALELRSDAILHGVENFLASPKLKKFTHELARKAAVIYRAIEKVF
ncbi:uncharacterized protein LOC134802456 isoform X1 [Cydia splendana]|uniref:uncharacterized protein LOC134802456 isoform X1 n=1 Tax=Cydia splendana TaxID=1100963 RepID=UPI00300CCD97